MNESIALIPKVGQVFLFGLSFLPELSILGLISMYCSVAILYCVVLYFIRDVNLDQGRHGERVDAQQS